MSTAMIVGLLVVVFVIVIAIVSRGSGPRVTHIETRRESEEGEERE
jgi:hypothetical protein